MEEDLIYCRGNDCEATSPLDGGFNRAEQRRYHEWCREDAHGIYTGHYCNACFENNYPYRKDKYPTQETDGHGDYLGEDDPEQRHWDNVATWNERHSDHGEDY